MLTKKNIIYLSILFALTGVFAVFETYYTGREESFNLTREVPWGMHIVGYIFFVAISTGLCLIASLGHIFKIKDFDQMGKHLILLSIVTLFAAFFVIGLELEYPLRLVVYNVVSPNFHSPMWWMGTLYGVYTVLLIAEFYFLNKKQFKLAGILGLIGVGADIVAHANLGALFSVARPFWSGAFLPPYFIVLAVQSGASVMVIFLTLIKKHNNLSIESSIVAAERLMGIAIGVLFLFQASRILSSAIMSSPDVYLAAMSLIAGPLAFYFWFGEVFLGMILPVVLLVKAKKSGNFGLLAAFASIAGMFFMRYNHVVAGQLVPIRKYYKLEMAGDYVIYSPSLVETATIVGAVGFTFLFYYLAERYFKMEKEIS
ncbi:polysulfide reductase NrfD [bacterium]|nr:polysulfide reductase NrfD [bacterium]